MPASTKTIGILSAVVLGGLGLWYMTKDDEETLDDTPSGNGGGGDAGEDENTDVVTCNEGDGMNTCPADKPLCEDGECIEATSKFATHVGSLYPAYGISDLLKPDTRKSFKGSEMCAKACLDDPDCIAFTHWEERYNADNPKVDGENPTWEDSDSCYYWSGPQGTDTTISPKAAVGPAHEGKDIEDDPEAHNSIGRTYILSDKEDYVPDPDSTTVAEAEDETPAYKPSTAPSGSGYIIADSSTTSETSW